MSLSKKQPLSTTCISTFDTNPHSNLYTSESSNREKYQKVKYPSIGSYKSSSKDTKLFKLDMLKKFNDNCNLNLVNNQSSSYAKFYQNKEVEIDELIIKQRPQKPQKPKKLILTRQGIEEELQSMRAFLETKVIQPKKRASLVLRNQYNLRLRQNILFKEPKPSHSVKRRNKTDDYINNSDYSSRANKKNKSNISQYHSNTFKQNYRTKVLSSTMIAFRVGKERNDHYKYDSKDKKKMTHVSRLKLKLHTIKFLIDQKKDIINKLFEPWFQEQLLNLSIKKKKEYNTGITIEEFGRLLQNNGITNNPEIIRKMYWIFDENGDNDLEYGEILAGIEIFRETTPEEKARLFFKLCDTDGSHTISKEEFMKVIKKSIVNSDGLIITRKAVDRMFKELCTNSNGELTLEEFIYGFKTYKELADIVNNNAQELKDFEELLDKEIVKDIMKFHPSQNAFLRQKFFGMKYEYCPIQEIKFAKMIQELINTKQVLQSHRKKYTTDYNVDMKSKEETQYKEVSVKENLE